MVSLTCTASRTDGVTLVTGRLTNPDRPRRIRLENQLDGPVWHPRERGVPAEGWDEDGLEVVVAADETRPVGYATPAAPADEPMRVAETTTVAADELAEFEPGADVPAVEANADDVVRTLGSPQPPRDAVPLPEVSGADGDSENDAWPETGGDVQSEPGSTRGSDRAAATEESVAEVFAAVERRVALAERVSEGTQLSEAAAAVAEAGGLDGLQDVADRLEGDAERLRDIERRAAVLAERAEAAEVPTETVARLR